MMAQEKYNIATEDVVYLRHGERQMMARLFAPVRKGLSPAYVDLHGGAWNLGSIDDRTSLGEFVAARGITMATLDFRHGADGYPTSLADINYAIRWVKANAEKLAIDPHKIVLGGASSGGHLAMLAAMRPHDPRYTTIPLSERGAEIDATVNAVVLQWPVINPLSRYFYAQRLQAGPNPPEWSNGTKEKHDNYWKTSAAMAEGNPMLILERQEKAMLPPACYIQGHPDDHHDYHDPESEFPGNEPERFVDNYRKAGGDIEIVYFDNAERGTAASHRPVVDFIEKQVGTAVAAAE